MELQDNLKKAGIKGTTKRTDPVWHGPEKDGITYSLLSRFLVCRERFRCLVVEGLKPPDHFNARVEFGNMWHICEEAMAKRQGTFGKDADLFQREALLKYATDLCKQYPLARNEIVHWWEFAKEMFPLYVEHWSQHADVTNRTPLLQEEPFNVPYKLPSGRVVKLRGKWDSVDLIGTGKEAGIYLQENKTKSSIDARKIQRQLRFDLQTMFYLVALQGYDGNLSHGLAGAAPIRGVRYNVIRRSAHKSVGSMLKKLTEDRDDGRIGEWFARWKVEITPKDLERFRKRTLDPVLETLTQWFDWVTTGSCDAEILAENCHWQHPFGVYNVLDEGGASELDEYLETGSEAGLTRTNNLFPELT